MTMQSAPGYQPPLPAQGAASIGDVTTALQGIIRQITAGNAAIAALNTDFDTNFSALTIAIGVQTTALNTQLGAMTTAQAAALAAQTAAIAAQTTALNTQLAALTAAVLAVFPPAVFTGSFTLGAAATTVVNNGHVLSSSIIILFPTNAAAGNLMGSALSLYISAKSTGVSFTVATASGAAAVGSETFSYVICNL